MPRPDRPPAPARDHLGWWLMIRCGCGYLVDYPVRLLIEHYGPEADLHRISARLRCLNCKERPASVDLVDRPDRRGEAHGGGASATIKPLP